MKTSYPLGNILVASAILGALALCLAGLTPAAPSGRAGQDLSELGLSLGAFSLQERSGETVTEADLADEVWVASFIFTRCPLSCPRISSVMKSLQGRFEGRAVKLVSLSVDPEHDTPEVLSEYARRFGADPDRWWFLTGPKDVIHGLITNGFRLPVQASDEASRAAGAEDVLHSDRLALVDHGKLVGVFDSKEPRQIEELIQAADGLASKVPGWARLLPAVNASLNATCGVLLAVGWFFIRAGRAQAHAACMIAAVVAAALFLTCYLTYHYQVGSMPFRGAGPIRTVYFTILYSHTFLAAFGVVPLAAVTLTRAARKQFARHAQVARITFPIWMYVSITGVIIYFMLYQMPLPTPSGGL